MKIARFVPIYIKTIIHLFLDYIYYNSVQKKLKRTCTTKRILIIGTPEHGNLGDHLIAEAELQFFDDHFSDYTIIEITGPHYRLFKDTIAKLIFKTDVIVITGGGFLGTLWMDEEIMVRDIIETYKGNKVVILPSTVYYETSDFGRREFENSIRIYSKHEDLTIFVRDAGSIKTSLALVGPAHKNKIIYIPDIALYLNRCIGSYERFGILLCLRDDKEKVLSDIDADLIRKIARDNFMEIKDVSTVIHKRVKKEIRHNELEKLICQFRKSQLVITDRLHGMIMAVITGTPCIALDNFSGKVSGGYSWIKHLNYIDFVCDVREIEPVIGKFLKMPGQIYENAPLIQEFKKIETIIRDEDNPS